MKTIILILVMLALSACYAPPKCVNVVYFHQNEQGVFTDHLWFTGKLHNGFLGYKGRVTDLVMIPDEVRKTGAGRCTEDARLEDGFYSVNFYIPGGPSYYFSGHGWGSTVYIIPNQLSEKHLQYWKGYQEGR